MSEVEKFDLLASDWWNVDGSLKMLHQFNQVRIPYIASKIINKNATILDVGCGGGICTEGLYDAGFVNISGIDLAPNSIEIAKQHCGTKKIKYNNISIFDVDQTFDVILCLEVLEHIENFKSVVECIFEKTNNNGLIIFSTINKTIRAFFESIIIPEYILGIVDKNTHHFNQLITPNDIFESLLSKNYSIIDIKGVSYNIINKMFYMRDNIDSNYFIILQKNNCI